MRNLTAFLFSLLLASSVIGQELPDPQTKFQTQLAASCDPTLQIEKTISDLSEEDAEPETRTLMVSCELEAASGDTLSLKQELAALFEQYYGDPFLVDNYEEERTRTTISTQLKPEIEDEFDLKSQEFSFAPDEVTLLSAVSHIHRDTWFYEIDIVIEVNFDEEGKYQSHSQTTSTKVLFFSESFSTQIKARRVN